MPPKFESYWCYQKGQSSSNGDKIQEGSPKDAALQFARRRHLKPNDIIVVRRTIDQGTTINFIVTQGIQVSETA